MNKSQFTESQIVAIISEAGAGVKVRDVCRKHGISPAIDYQRKPKHCGLGASELKRIKDLEAENAELKFMYADVSLERHAMQKARPKELNGR